MKKCPYCFTELDDRASICSSCRKKIGRRGKNGIAKTHSPWLLPIILFVAIPMLVLPFFIDSPTTPDEEAYKKAVAKAQKRMRAGPTVEEKATTKTIAPGEAINLSFAQKKKICDHITIADDISGDIGRDLDEGRKLVAKHFNITMEQLTEISVEGLKELWSLPPESARNEPEYKYLHGKGKKTPIHKNLDRYSCYELGYRFGKCVARSMKGMKCDPENDFVMPPRCRNRPETNKGMMAGLKSVR